MESLLLFAIFQKELQNLEDAGDEILMQDEGAAIPYPFYSVILSPTIKFFNIFRHKNVCINQLNLQIKRLYCSIICPKDAYGMTTNEDPDQTAPLIWACTVCLDLSVRKLRIIKGTYIWEQLG